MSKMREKQRNREENVMLRKSAEKNQEKYHHV